MGTYFIRELSKAVIESSHDDNLDILIKRTTIAVTKEVKQTPNVDLNTHTKAVFLKDGIEDEQDSGYVSICHE